MELTQGSSQKLSSFVREIDQIFDETYGRGKRGDENFESFRREVKIKCLLNGVTDNIYSRIRRNLKHDNDDFTWQELVEGVQDAEWLWTLSHKPTYCVGKRTSSDNSGDFKVDEDGFVIVYTDGACSRNGQPDAQAGIGIWFDYHHKLNVSKPLNSKYPATNNVAELRAVIDAVNIVRSYRVERLTIHTDSQYIIDCITGDWISYWLDNDWRRKSNGQPVEHKKLFRELLKAIEDMDIRWIHVKSHSYHTGNIEADRLARQGAEQHDD